MPPDSATWYVLIGEQETGPLTRVELGVELASGAIPSDSLVWKEGMANWLPGVRIPELEALFKNPPRSPRAAAARPPPPPSKKQGQGLGLSDFDTSHFRLADLKAEEGAATRQLEFDTSHFRLADLKGAQGARALVPRRIVPKGMEAPVELQSPSHPGKAGPRSALKQASTAAAKPLGAAPVAVRQASGVAGTSAPPPVAAKAAPAPVARAEPRPAAVPPRPLPGPVESDFDPNATAVDFRTLGELVHQQVVAQSLFETELVPAEAKVLKEPAPPAPPAPEKPAADPQADALSAWAAKELQTSAAAEQKPDLAAMLKAKARAASPPPVPRAEGKSWLPTAVAIAGALAMAVALLWVLLAD